MVEASPITFVTSEAPPCMFVHGEMDTVYPPSQSELMHQRLLKAGARSVCRIVPGTGHGFHGYDDGSGILDESIGFLNACL